MDSPSLLLLATTDTKHHCYYAANIHMPLQHSHTVFTAYWVITFSSQNVSKRYSTVQILAKRNPHQHLSPSLGPSLTCFQLAIMAQIFHANRQKLKPGRGSRQDVCRHRGHQCCGPVLNVRSQHYYTAFIWQINQKFSTTGQAIRHLTMQSPA